MRRISLLYATVGQAGGTAFLALMAFAGFPSTDGACTQHRGCGLFDVGLQSKKVVDWRKLRPLLFSSLPTALAGGFIVFDERVYKTTTGVALFLAGATMVLRREGRSGVR